MPTYDYKCNDCGHAWELFQSMTAKPEKVCPSCGKRAAERLIGRGGAIIFKGAGFYETDYRSPDYKKAADAESKAGEHAHTGSCACGAKPAGECASQPTPSTAQSAAPESPAKVSVSAKGRNAPAPARKPPAKKAPSRKRA